MENLLRYQLIIFLFFISSQSIAQPPATFREAKKLMIDVYQQNPRTFYCGCAYRSNYQGRRLKPDLASCNYMPRKPKDRRYKRVEWEHVMPASWLGRNRACWKNGGRKNCRATDPVFNQIEGEMVNLVPSVGEINRDRSNYKFSIIPSEKRQYNQCDFEVDNKKRTVEPTPSIRGDIARTMLFMSKRYDIRLTKQQLDLYQLWHKEDPVDYWEKLRDKKIREIQGYSNDLVYRSN